MSSSTASNKRVFREYIGAQGRQVQFGNVPINPDVEFHFILAFALDYTHSKTAPMPTDGKFSEFWDTVNLTPQAVEAVKKKHTNVRVMLSIGGATVGGLNREARFEPMGEASWVENALQTLIGLIDMYHLDGVDINYESFGVDSGMFARCIGALLRRLKDLKPALITSIAPYIGTQRYYQALWNGHSHLIDYVNFQFYANQPNTTVDQYINLYNEQADIYGHCKVLAAINTSHPNDVNIVVHRDVALEACQALNSTGNLNAGIFIWSADSSSSNEWGYHFEEMAQQMLAS